MKIVKIKPHKSSLGMDANLTSLVIFAVMAVVSWMSYLGWLAWVIPLVFYFAEKKSRFVKFQAVTALIIGIIRVAFSIVLQILVWILTPRDFYSALSFLTGGWGIWTVVAAISTIIGIIISFVIVYLIWMAWNYNKVYLPFVGPLAEKASAKLENININQSRNTSEDAKDDSDD